MEIKRTDGCEYCVSECVDGRVLGDKFFVESAKYAEVGDGYPHSVPMNYCPNCGRSLNGYGVRVNMYDVEEGHENCSIQILKNTVNGEISIGWKTV